MARTLEPRTMSSAAATRRDTARQIQAWALGGQRGPLCDAIEITDRAAVRRWLIDEAPPRQALDETDVERIRRIPLEVIEAMVHDHGGRRCE